jgi:D-alanyl-D-alanine carboxypeptidase
MYANGRLPAPALRTVAPGVRLASPTAVSWNAFVLVARERYGWTIRPASGVGSGYRDLATQALYWKAGQGDAAAAAQVGLSSVSSAAIAAPGASSHGFGTAIDAVFNGSERPSPGQLQLAARYGFTLTIKGDPNHLGHDGNAHNVTDHDYAAIIAAYLNGRDLPGHRTGTEESGTRGDYYWTRLQQAGRQDGLYMPPLVIDGNPLNRNGTPGVTKRVLEPYYWNLVTRA